MCALHSVLFQQHRVDPSSLSAEITMADTGDAPMDYPHTGLATEELEEAESMAIVGGHAVPDLRSLHGCKGGSAFLPDLEGLQLQHGWKQRPVDLLKQTLETCEEASALHQGVRTTVFSTMHGDDEKLLPCCECGHHACKESDFESEPTIAADDCALCGHRFAASALAPTASAPAVDLCDLCMELVLLITVVRSLTQDDPRRNILERQLQILVDWLTTPIAGLPNLQEWI